MKFPSLPAPGMEAAAHTWLGNTAAWVAAAATIGADPARPAGVGPPGVAIADSPVPAENAKNQPTTPPPAGAQTPIHDFFSRGT